MPVRVITPPGEVVSLDDAKKHLRVDHNDDDAYITALIAGAVAWLDGPAGWLGRALGTQVLELITDRFGDCCRDWLELPYPPVIEIISVIYIDPTGAEITMPVDDYQLALGKMRPAFGTSWPSLRYQPDAVRIQYRAGYGTPDSADPPNWTNGIPAPIKVAILMLTGQWYENREPVALGATVENMPFAVDALLSTFRVYR